MIRKAAIALGVGTAVLLGGAGTALAVTSDSTPAAPAPAPAAHGEHARLRGEYGQWTTFDATTRVTTVHDVVRGTAGAVSPTSVTVRAADGSTKTYAVDGSTKVHVKGAAGTIDQVEVGDRVVVLGTGTDSLTATHIGDRGAAAPAG